ncbi:MAG: hypothetical protein HZB35_06025, partial [Nitrospirae bacterium]|nr:hypothetical protein [Nitrospirota bacterium]
MRSGIDHNNAFWVAMVLVVFSVAGAGLAWGQSTWADEVMNAIAFYSSTYPTSDFGPYVGQVGTIRAGLTRDDQQVVRIETEALLKMLMARAHGIHDVAADELYNVVRSASITPETTGTSIASDLEVGHERPMSVPDSVENTPFEGG